MSKATRPTLAALLGAATLSLGAQIAQAETQSDPSLSGSSASAQTAHYQHVQAPPQDDAGDSLRSLIDERLDQASQRGRHDEIDQLATLWMTLAQRDQLDRVVERGEGFLNVALRNQRYSAHRSEARQRRATLASGIEKTALGSWNASFPSVDEIDERMDVERFVAALDPPYRDAVTLSLTGMNHREVAEELGVSHAATRKWAQRLRERLAVDDDELLS